jgi:hypothetical protein
MADLVMRCVMKRSVVFLVAVLTATAMVGAFPALADDDGVPFKGSGDLTLTSQQMLPHGNVLLTFVGTGQGTELGQFTEDAVVVLHKDGSFSAIVVLTADDNGDQVFKSAQGASIGVGNFRINGGTGRFRGATGSGIVKHDLSGGFGDVEQTYDGTIQLNR